MGGGASHSRDAGGELVAKLRGVAEGSTGHSSAASLAQLGQGAPNGCPTTRATPLDSTYARAHNAHAYCRQHMDCSTCWKCIMHNGQ